MFKHFGTKKFWVKATALSLLLCMLNQVFTQTAFALTSGPTAPEATSFEPVDTTDLVNALTGDLTYNLPLIEVPGPDGGYPLSLSYHAGIQPNEDASWVGLGWSLNPGAINRNVNGFPDDWYHSQSSRRDYWEGGIRTTHAVGLSIPIGGGVNVSMGLSMSNDTYKGIGVGFRVGLSVTVPFAPNAGIGPSVGIGVGVSDYGEFYGYGSVGLGFTDKKKILGSQIGLSFSSLSSGTNFYAGLTFMGAAALGINISGGKISGSISPGMTSSIENGSSGNVSTVTTTKSVNLILIDYTKQKTRYWSDETEASTIYGSLNRPYDPYLEIPDSYAFDGYSLQEENKNIIDDPNPIKQQGGAFPSFDMYQVSGQGIGGTMRPYRFTGEVHQQNHYERSGPNSTYRQVTYASNSIGDEPAQFRFEGDFSNNYIQDYTDYGTLDATILFYDPPFADPSYDSIDWFDGYYNGVLAGTSNIQYYITKEDGTVDNYGIDRKFINPVAAGLSRRAHTYMADYSRHIAGFSITNENGITYHYNLPAYTYDEEAYQERKDRDEGLMFNRQTKEEGYAYTWYLTAVTGADYVDRGTIGAIDSADYGYYVSFEYGKWADKSLWRNPSEGYHSDDDNEFKFVSMGKKEVYYLNAIRTRTHVALFEKHVRDDAKGSGPQIFDKNWSSQNSASTDYQNEGVFNVYSTRAMRLDKIYLFKAEDAPTGLLNLSYFNAYYVTDRIGDHGTGEQVANVLEKLDVNAFGRAAFEAAALKIIDFNYDYSLTRGTANSFDTDFLTVKKGKLTLNSVSFRGKGGVSLLPPIEFSYGLDAAEQKTLSGTLSTTQFQSTNGSLEVGDLVETTDANPIYCGAVVAKSGSGTYTYTLKNGNYTGSSVSKTLRTTKNPPYNKDAYDLWNMYKSDYTASTNENVSRATSITSNKSVDVWSLRKVRTATGAEIKINYEGDTYGKSVLNRNHSLLISNFTNLGSGNFSFTAGIPANETASDYFNVGNKLDMILLKQLAPNGGNPYSYSVLTSPLYSYAPTITAISGNTITVNVNSSFNTDITSTSGGRVPSIITGNLKLRGGSKFYGGGIRVKSITVDNLSGTKNITSFDYIVPGTSTSSGVTSYEPVLFDMDNVMAVTVSDDDPARRAEARKAYRRELYNNANPLLTIAREIPSPGIMYEYVTTSYKVYNDLDQQARDVPGKSVMQFEVFRENMVGRQDATSKRTGPRSPGGAYYTRNVVLRKFVSNIGALKRATTYGYQGNKLTEVINHYLHDGLENLHHNTFMAQYEQRLIQFKKQGLTKERFSEVKAIWDGVNEYVFDVLATMTGREEYPAILLGQTVNDYTKGTVSSTRNLAFDFYSGAPIKKVETDGYGNRFMSEALPAYRVYPEMGLMTISGFYKNMLNQVAANYLYKVDTANNKLGLVSASAQLWTADKPVLDVYGNSLVQNNHSTTGKIWRKGAAYAWMSAVQTTNGLTDINAFEDFNWLSPLSSNANWKQVADFTLYDVYSKPLESTDINGQYSALKLGYKNSKITMSGTPGRYTEFAFSSAEDMFTYSSQNFFPGNISPGTASIDTAKTYVHTGHKSLSISAAGTGYTYAVPINQLDPVQRSYQAAVWVKSTDFSSVSGARLYYKVDNNAKVSVAPTAQKVAAGWYLLQLTVPVSALTGSTLTIGCENVGGSVVHADDFRFQPFDSGSTAYVYDIKTDELTHILDNNNLFVKYEYDAAGRLIKVYKEILGKNYYPPVKENIYNHKRSVH